MNTTGATQFGNIYFTKPKNLNSRNSEQNKLNFNAQIFMPINNRDQNDGKEFALNYKFQSEKHNPQPRSSDKLENTLETRENINNEIKVLNEISGIIPKVSENTGSQINFRNSRPEEDLENQNQILKQTISELQHDNETLTTRLKLKQNHNDEISKELNKIDEIAMELKRKLDSVEGALEKSENENKKRKFEFEKTDKEKNAMIIEFSKTIELGNYSLRAMEYESKNKDAIILALNEKLIEVNFNKNPYDELQIKFNQAMVEQKHLTLMHEQEKQKLRLENFDLKSIIEKQEITISLINQKSNNYDFEINKIGNLCKTFLDSSREEDLHNT